MWMDSHAPELFSGHSHLSTNRDAEVLVRIKQHMVSYVEKSWTGQWKWPVEMSVACVTGFN